MQITSKGQVTIPKDIRDLHGFLPYTEVDFKTENNRVYLEQMPSPSGKTPGRQMIERMVGQGDVMMDMTTDEIMALLRGED